MRRLLVATAIAALVLGVLAPAQADEETIPFGNGANCTVNPGSPFQEILLPLAYVSSRFTVNCQPASSAYRIDRVTVDLFHRQSTGDGTWGPYSNDHSIKTRNTAGTLSYLPMRDVCNTGGAQRYYQQQATVEVVWVRLVNGAHGVYDRTWNTSAATKRPCGANEPG